MTRNETNGRRAMRAFPRPPRSVPYFHPMRDADFSSDSNENATSGMVQQNAISISSSSNANAEVRSTMQRCSTDTDENVAASEKTQQRIVLRIDVQPPSSNEIDVKIRVTKRNTNSRQIPERNETHNSPQQFFFAAPYNPEDENVPIPRESHEATVSLIRKRWEVFADANINNIRTNGYPIKVMIVK